MIHRIKSSVPNLLLALLFGMCMSMFMLTVQTASAQCTSPLVSVTYTVHPPTCNGGTDGSVDVVVTGGGAPYTYTIAGSTISFQSTSGGSAHTFTNLPADPSFFINVQVKIPTGFAVCNYSGAIVDPAPITITSSTTDVSCPSGSNGAITISSISGGSSPYTFLWSNGATTQNISGLTAGNYSVDIKAANNCTQTFNFTVNEPPPIAITSTVTNVSCNGSNTGAITLNTVTGGTPGYTYLWSNGATTQNISGLTAGPYSVTVTDANGCPQVFNFTITQPLPIATTSTVTNAMCNGSSDGAITLNTVTGGTPGYTFLWSNGATTQNISGLAAGAYSVTVTDANGCPQVFNFNVAQPTAIAVTSTVTNIFCSGSSTGAITLNTVTGGTPGYTFLWSNGATTQNISGLAAGAYSVTVTDANGCPQVFNFNVTQLTTIAITSTVTNVLCNGGNTGAITLTTVTGGTPAYTFLWSNGATTQNISGLTAGAYSVTVTDANGCSQSFNFNVTQTNLLATTSTITNVLCNGSNTGAITLNTVTGGTPAYTFLWSNGATTQNISGLTAGAYSVSVTDANGCSRVFNFNVTEPAVLATTSTVANVSCNGSNNGSITLNTVTGGTPAYTFLWSNGATTQNISGLVAGPYSVTVTDANGCSRVFNFNITAPSALATTSTVTNVTCNGGSNGTITLNTVTGGTPAYTFLWSNGAITQNVTGLTAGSYSVTVTDANACSQVFNFNITQATPIANTSTITNVTCTGGSNGSITLNTVTGGTPGYTFLWSNGATTQNISGLTAGAYSVTVTDANGCPQVFNFNVSQPVPIAVTSSITNTTCNGGSNGAITLTTVTGGTPGYTFLWSNGAITQNISGLTAGAYSVTITDASGCPGQVFNFTVTQPPVIAATSSVTNVSCNGGSNGAITLLTVTGGTPGYTFLWSNGATTQNISGLTAGPYSVTITDANGCPQVLNFTITAATAISSTTSVTNVACNGGSTGAIDITSISGGTPAYTFLWSNGATTQNVSGLVAGPYSVTITDANSCTQVVNLNVTEPTPIATTSTVTNVTCNGGNNGAITLNTVSGGTPGYTFLWNTGATTQNVTGLTAGAYSVTVTDANSCPLVVNFNITEPVPLAITSNTTNTTCIGSTDGAIVLNTISGGTAPYTFLWSTGATTQNISGLVAGAYSVSISDAGACPAQVFNFNITDPAALAITSTVVDATCNGGTNGSISIITITGGTPAYTFLWSTGATTQNVTGLAAGPYSVSISDANGCPAQVFNFTVAAPSVISITSSTTPVSCNGGSDGTVNINTISGGTAPYTFLWNTGVTTQNVTGLGAGSPSVTITDANSCSQVFNFTVTEPTPIVPVSSVTNTTCHGGNNGAITISSISGATPGYTFLWNTGATTQSISSLTAGAYSVTITDATGCPQLFNFTVTEPSPIAITSNVTNSTTCAGNDGTITLSTVTGGTAPYAFLWNTGATTQNLNGLNAGAYSVTITDANSCSDVFNFSISDPTTFNVTDVVTDVTCNGAANGAIDLTITLGTAPFNISWDNGAITEDLSGLAGGIYTVSITDANNCTHIQPYTVDEPAPIAITSASSDVTTCGGSDGSITLNTVTGGTPGYTFLWSNGATTQNISGLTAGIYTVTITDINNCTRVANFTISDPTSFTVSDVTTDLTCNGAANGAIDLTVAGGTGPFTYSWTNGATTEDLTGLSGGSYIVTITDANNCTYNHSYPVAEPLPIAITSNVSNVTTCGGSNGSIDIAPVTGGTAPYTFLWNTGATGTSIIGLSAGAYSVSITDANGCLPASVFNFTVSDPLPYTLSITKTDVTCNGSANGTIDLTVTGGATPFNYVWDNGAITEDLSGLAAGTYNVTVTDANGCTGNTGTTISEPAIIATTSTTSNVTCNSGNNGSITILTITGGTPTYTFLWNTGASTQNIAGLSAGNYSVTITDLNGCPHTENFTISEPAPLTENSTVVNPTTCGGTNGSITINSIGGGTAPFAFLWSTGTTTQNITGLSNGLYSVTVTDANSCSQVFNYTLSDPALFTVSDAVTNILCNGNNTGAIDITVTGAVAPITYSWSNGATTEDLTGIPAGTYFITISDASGCNSITPHTVTEPAAITALISATNTSNCSSTDGAITLSSISGGTSPYTFLWSNGATTQNISSLASGNYSVNISDVNSCAITLNASVSSPTPFTVTASITNVNCSSNTSGAISLTLSGETTPVSILWSTGATTQIISGLTAGSYSVSITDASACPFFATYPVSQPAGVDTVSIVDTTTPVICPGSNEGSIVLTNITGGASPYTYILNGISSPVPSYDSLTGGPYTMSIVDANGCTSYHTFTIYEPAPLSFMAPTTPSVCTNNNGTLSITAVSGGTPGYSYSIDNGATYSSQTVYTGLAPATYNVFMRDTNLCTYGYPVAVILKPGPVPYIRTQSTTCNGLDDGAIIVDSLVGGVSPFFFYLNGQDRGSSKAYTGLTAGNYKLAIEDAECRYKVQYYYVWNSIKNKRDTIIDSLITVIEPAPVTASTLVTDSYNKTSSGQAIVYNITGGTSPYQYTLDTTAGYTSLADTAIFLSGLNKGDYKVFLLDTNGCTGEVTVRIRISFFIPNLITPNGDDQNDYFEIMALPLHSRLVIYNRWNERVYEDSNYNNSWEAKGLSDGVYYYELKLPNGNDYKGWLQVLR